MHNASHSRTNIRQFVRDSAKGTAVAVMLILIFEILLRVVAFGWYRSEYYLFYGVHNWVGRVGVNPWSTIHGQYYKFPPNYVLKGADGQTTETAAINSHGFRGPEFQTAKPKGTFRVISLGESSTFGYRDRDYETYPFLLGRLFVQEQLPVEVINAGFPYYNSGSILSLLQHEIMDYDPDLITLYAGYNDTNWPFQVGYLGRTTLWFESHSITYLLFRQQISSWAFGAESKVLTRIIPQVKPRPDNSEAVAQRYGQNVRAMIRIAKSRAIPMILIKQPVTAHGRNYERITFEQEYQSIKDRIAKAQPVLDPETYVFKQHRLMEELEEITREENLPIVDNIKIVDQDRRRLGSWVHLTGEANLRLAEALEPVIKRYAMHHADGIEASTNPR